METQHNSTLSTPVKLKDFRQLPNEHQEELIEHLSDEIESYDYGFPDSPRDEEHTYLPSYAYKLNDIDTSKPENKNLAAHLTITHGIPEYHYYQTNNASHYMDIESEDCPTTQVFIRVNEDGQAELTFKGAEVKEEFKKQLVEDINKFVKSINDYDSAPYVFKKNRRDMSNEKPEEELQNSIRDDLENNLNS
jgi:hypothetical protein